MKNKPAKVNFFKLNPGKAGGVEEFKSTLNTIFECFKKHDFKSIPTLEMDGDKYYIQAMQQRFLEDKYEEEMLYYWLITISRVDFDQEIIVADVTKSIDERRREIEHSKDEGIVVDTRIAFDPFRNILAVYAQRGTINNYYLRRFICNLVGKRGIQFQIILNEDGYKRIDKLDIVNQIAYKVASPNNFLAYANESRDELADLKFAREVKGTELAIVLKSEQLEEKKIKSKIKSLLSSSSGMDVKSLKVEGIADGVEDTIDLIKNRLIYEGSIIFADEIDDRAAYGLLNKAYDKYYNYIKKTFQII